MPFEPIAAANLDKKELNAIDDAVFMRSIYDRDGDSKRKGGIHCFMLPDKPCVRLLTMFPSREGVQRTALLEVAGQMGENHLIAGVAISPGGRHHGHA